MYAEYFPSTYPCSIVPTLTESFGFRKVSDWLDGRGFQPLEFQLRAWEAMHRGLSGIVTAPTGFGKTYSLFLGFLIGAINENHYRGRPFPKGKPLLVWITPLKSLAADIALSMETVVQGLGLPWKVAVRNGDTPMAERQRQKKQFPEIVIITPESLHLLLANKGNGPLFHALGCVVIDEFHELLGSKRGVLVELALSRILSELKNHLSGCDNGPIADGGTFGLWGLSATLANIEYASAFLAMPLSIVKPEVYQEGRRPEFSGIELIRAEGNKKIDIRSIIPGSIEDFPWAGHIGLKLAPQLLGIIEGHASTLVFINTRGMSEIWYQALLQLAPSLSGALAIHHGSLDREMRQWVENSIREGSLKAVICTSSLDLGVDFSAVDAVVQVGSPKGVSRFLQRAGRSGHSPFQASTIYFLPTNALELIEATALKLAVAQGDTEEKMPLKNCYDVLAQYICTLSVGDGFLASETFFEIKKTYCFSLISCKAYMDMIEQFVSGGKAFSNYPEFRKIEMGPSGKYHIATLRQAFVHRMNIGTIVNEATLKVQIVGGKFLGEIEEGFISKLKEGDVFTLAGKNLALVSIKDMTVFVKVSKSKKTNVPSWLGGRMSLSSNLSFLLRKVIAETKTGFASPEAQALAPLFLIQSKLSHVPSHDELLVELIHAADGTHLLVYPFEGRAVHEALSTLFAYRIGKYRDLSFSIAMNDYGFELFSETPFEVSMEEIKAIFSEENLVADLGDCINKIEATSRKFRDIAIISGILQQQQKNKQRSQKHLHASSTLLFKVIREFDPENMFLQQAMDEVLSIQMEENRLRQMLRRFLGGAIIITTPKKFTPFSFPIIVDGLNRNTFSSEKITERILSIQGKMMEELPG